MPLPIRPEVASLPAYVPGRPAGGAGGGAGGPAYKLSSNENPYPPLPGVLEAVTAACARMNRYPDLANTEATEALAGRLGLGTDRVALGTGSVAVLYHLLQAVSGPGDEVVHAWRSFEAYPIAVQLTGATGVRVPLTDGARHDLDAMAAAITDRTRAVLLCTPNNPTGPALDHDAVAAFVAQVPEDVLVVVDEAYVEFSDRPGVCRGPELLDRPNVVVLRTLSKAYGLAGFRVGYCLGDPELIRAVRAVSLPFGVSIPAQAAVVASLAHETELLDRVAALVAERTRVVDGLRGLGWDVPEAQGNFFWLPTAAGTATWNDRFAAAGLTVRPFADGGRWDGLRITVGETEANDRVLEVAAAHPR
ncbi:histidinol-phosphate aminotransferase [Friedmanniella endophytica]|uniref:Aromatic amino acid aminotransferase n=1 Tax=Microlunatus kandeliicorticis TaxID=1759536 RepID=A0A7W3IPB1_9ACTN|nr:histidinol-phosphate transaminase [Microlunatus kandeliicorticis]MBA8792741.1 histidinol-phosphate aminotransferase [Microlunatus kandeliicorticis]